MLSREENRLLTRIGPGTPMGDMLREYWVPACRSAKLEAEGAPERVRLFGENFVAFRATDGRVGFIGEGCPHRCASMALARNEGNGLRCIFHGWKVSVDGVCVDAPTEPPERREEFAKRVPVRHHPVREAGGMVWVYLGQQAEPPAFYDFEFNSLPPEQVTCRRAIIKVNWLQGLEALLDSAHVSFLHTAYTTEASGVRRNTSPAFQFVDKPYGFREGALRDLDDGTCYARIREVVMPFFSFIPFAPGEQTSMVCSIPIDDEHSAQWYINYNPWGPLTVDLIKVPGATSGDPDNFCSDLGDVTNLWHQSRDLMAKGHWTGVNRCIAYEDFIVQESMGPIVDRRGEYLSAVDAVIVRARRMLSDAVRRFQETKVAPWTGRDMGYDRVRALSITFPDTEDWRQMDTFMPPAPAAVPA